MDGSADEGRGEREGRRDGGMGEYREEGARLVCNSLESSMRMRKLR